MSLTKLSLGGHKSIIPGRVWLVTSRPGKGKSIAVFYSVGYSLQFSAFSCFFGAFSFQLVPGLFSGIPLKIPLLVDNVLIVHCTGTYTLLLRICCSLINISWSRSIILLFFSSPLRLQLPNKDNVLIYLYYSLL